MAERRKTPPRSPARAARPPAKSRAVAAPAAPARKTEASGAKAVAARSAARAAAPKSSAPPRVGKSRPAGERARAGNGASTPRVTVAVRLGAAVASREFKIPRFEPDDGDAGDTSFRIHDRDTSSLRQLH